LSCNAPGVRFEGDAFQKKLKVINPVIKEVDIFNGKVIQYGFSWLIDSLTRSTRIKDMNNEI